MSQEDSEGTGTLRKIIDHAPMAMAIVSFDGRIEYINRKAVEVFGYPHSDIPDMDRWWVQAYPDPAYRKEVIERWMGHVRAAIDRGGGEITSGEYLVTRKDGGKRHCRIFGVIAAGKVFVMFDDISDRVALESSLREGGEILKRIIDRAPMAVSIQNLDSSLDFINRKFTDLFGYTPDDVRDLHSFAVRFFPDAEYRAKTLATWKKWVKDSLDSGGNMPGGEFRVRRKDGEIRSVFISGGTTPDNKVISIYDDITERNRAAKELKDRESNLRLILERAPVAIVIHELSGHVTFVNRKFTQTFGYTLADIPDLETWTRKAYPDETYRKRFAGIWAEWIRKSRLNGEEMEGGNFSLVGKDGAPKTVFITGVVTPDGMVISLLEDITARIEAEKALRERESLYRALVETTGTGYVILDGQGKVLDANREYVRLSGHSDLKEILGRSVVEWSAPQDKLRAQEAVDMAVRERKVINFEISYIDKAGRLKPVQINATVVSRNGVPQILGLVRDISTRNKTEADLHERESIYRALVETTRTGYVVVDLKGNVLDANQEYVRLTGHTDLKQIVGRSVLEWTAPDQLQKNAAAVEQCVRDGKVLNFEVDYIDKKGRRTPIEINATVVNRAGTQQILTLCRDITERRKISEELLAFNQALEQRVQERTAELLKKNIELSHEIALRMDAERSREKLQDELLRSQKMEVVGRLAGGIAHDFNNILVAISGYAEFLLTTLPADSPARQDLTEIIHETERGALLTRQLTSLGRQQPVERRELDLNASVEDTVRLLRRLIGPNIKLQLALDPAGGPIFADAGQVSQVLLNLVVNARDAMPQGGEITVSTSNAEVPADAPMRFPPPPGAYTVLTVRDTGPGMSEETEARLFEPFFTTKAEGKGTGLGLSTVHRIISQCGGGIDLKTGPGGTTFSIYFPRPPKN